MTFAFLQGVVFGGLFSIPPGPAGTIIMKQARGGSDRERFRLHAPFHSLIELLLGDLVLLAFGLLLLQPFKAFFESQAVRAGAGLFLISFAIRELFTSPEPDEIPSGSVFRLAVANPGAWCSLFAVIALFSTVGQSSFLFFVGFEAGVALYFMLLIFFLSRLSGSLHKILLRAAVVIVALMGVFLLIPEATFGFTCEPQALVAKGERFDCRVSPGGKKFHVVRLRGNFSEGAYAHGRLLSNEALQGVIQDVTRRFEDSLNEGNAAQRKFKRAVAHCYFSRMKASVSSEFLRGMNAFARGLREGSPATSLTQKQIEESSLGIELSIAFEGLMRNIEIDPLGTYAELAGSCGLDFSIEGLKTFIELPLGLFKTMKLGCLGFSIPAGESIEGSLIHARNFDADLMESWNRAPALFLVEEPGYYKYAAATAAGMFYVGGVSGINEKGIAVSLHEMSTHRYRTWVSGRSGVVAPFLQTRILREAATLDEAIELIRKAKHFGGWTFFISDSKTNEVASVEVSAERIQVARRAKNESMGQSNHFLGSDMQDQFFTYNFNKALESNSRLTVITQELERSRGRMDLEWAIDHLSGHVDAFEGFRSFGRTATKVYTVMSTIALPEKNQFWVTLGDRRPASHSTFLGFEIGWADLSFKPVGENRTHQYDRILNWDRSLQTYGLARIAYEKHFPEMTERLLTKAIAEARADGVDEPPYIFMRGRVRSELKKMREAAEDFEWIWQHRASLHPYQGALAALYDVMTEANSAHLKVEKLNYAKDVLQKLAKETSHFDLERKLKLVRAVEKAQKVRSLPPLDFVTIE